jgi:AraC-like DNA-binding protein
VTLEDLIRLRRARDLIDREFARPLDVPAMARAAHVSPSHFARQYREARLRAPRPTAVFDRGAHARAPLA